MGSLIGLAASALGLRSWMVWLALAAVATGGLGFVTWRIYHSGYEAGSLAVQTRWDAAVKAERERQDAANADARKHQEEVAKEQAAAEDAINNTVQEIGNVPVRPNDPDRLGADRVRDLNRIK